MAPGGWGGIIYQVVIARFHSFVRFASPIHGVVFQKFISRLRAGRNPVHAPSPGGHQRTCHVTISQSLLLWYTYRISYAAYRRDFHCGTEGGCYTWGYIAAWRRWKNLLGEAFFGPLDNGLSGVEKRISSSTSDFESLGHVSAGSITATPSVPSKEPEATSADVQSSGSEDLRCCPWQSSVE